MEDEQELRAWLSLLRAPGLGPAALRQLVERAGDARTLLADPLAHAGNLRLNPEARKALTAPDSRCIAADRKWLDQPGHHLLVHTDPAFPPQLETIERPPAALFVAGNPDLLLRPQVAIVGARGASAQGLADAREFARRLAEQGIVVTSGMADGIDGSAHQASLDAGGATIAVLGTGIDVVYPRKHRKLAAAIAERGALVTEFVPGTPARSGHFPARNRVIAGLSLATVVVEASLRSGSLVSARLAAEQGREVFVLPGSVHSPQKRGCHQLIRDGAQLVETADEVLEAIVPAARQLGVELGKRLESAGASPQPPEYGADPAYVRLLDALGHDPASLDELAVRSGLGAQDLSSMLLILELEGHIASLPGGRFQRLTGHPESSSPA